MGTKVALKNSEASPGFKFSMDNAFVRVGLAQRVLEYLSNTSVVNYASNGILVHFLPNVSMV